MSLSSLWNSFILNFQSSEIPPISLPSYEIFHIGSIGITNGFLGSLLVSVTLIGFSIYAAKGFSVVPSRIQVVLEMMADYIINQLEDAFGSKEKAMAFFPMMFTILLFITVANQFSLIPLIFQITFEGVEVFRQPTSDFAYTITLSLVIVILSHILALKISPITHLSNFFPLGNFFKVRSLGDLANAFVELFIGILNIVGEIAKVVSLAARLFGNVYASNVMVVVIARLASFTHFLVPIPFIILSIFSGFIQAFVFMLLSIQFIAITVDGAKPKKEEIVESIDDSNVAIAA